MVLNKFKPKEYGSDYIVNGIQDDEEKQEDNPWMVKLAVRFWKRICIINSNSSTSDQAVILDSAVAVSSMQDLYSLLLTAFVPEVREGLIHYH